MGLQRKGINKMSDADAFRNLLLHLRPEAEEETGSAGEHPASNRLPRYASERAGLTAFSSAFLLRLRRMAKKTLCWREPCLPGVAPASFLRPRLAVDHVWRLHADAAVRPTGVVELDDPVQFSAACVHVGYPHLVEPFGLEYPVGAFGDGVLYWVSALGHADPDAMLLEFPDVGVAAVLAPSVGVVDQPG